MPYEICITSTMFEIVMHRTSSCTQAGMYDQDLEIIELYGALFTCVSS